MLEIVLSPSEWVDFTAEAKKIMRLNGMTNKDVAQLIGRKENAVSKFFTKNYSSRFIAAEIASALSMNWK
jgi:plasmid maintenance system antidote protein VapI